MAERSRSDTRQFRLDGIPEAMIVPVTINGSWVLMKNGLFPIPFGVKATWTVHPLIDPKDMNRESLCQQIEEQIVSAIQKQLSCSPYVAHKVYILCQKKASGKK